jgi:hypothetical protein
VTGFVRSAHWFHGTPDVRPIQASGGFTPRTEARRLISDPARLAALSAIQNDVSLSDVERLKQTAGIDNCWTIVQAPVPVFLSASRATAATYADDKRAFDYQNAEPAILTIACDEAPDVTLDARGESFRSMAWAQVAADLVKADLDPEPVRKMLFEQLPGLSAERIRVSDLGLALWSAGARIVDVLNVVDTHNGKGRADTVRMVFDPERITILEIDELLTPGNSGPEP